MSAENPLQHEIQPLLQQVQVAGGEVEEFGRMHLTSFREECESVLRWQRTEGRSLVLAGEEPDRVREQVEARIEQGRLQLREKLVHLLEWARGSGRM